MVHSVSNIIKALDKLQHYPMPDKRDAKQMREWVLRRVWNAIKHIFGQSDWQVARKEIKAVLVNTKVLSDSTAESVAESILRAFTDKKAQGIVQNVQTYFTSQSSGFHLTDWFSRLLPTLA